MPQFQVRGFIDTDSLGLVWHQCRGFGKVTGHFVGPVSGFGLFQVIGSLTLSSLHLRSHSVKGRDQSLWFTEITITYLSSNFTELISDRGICQACVGCADKMVQGSSAALSSLLPHQNPHGPLWHSPSVRALGFKRSWLSSHWSQGAQGDILAIKH